MVEYHERERSSVARMAQRIERQTIQFSVFYKDQTERSSIAPNAIADLFKQQGGSGPNLGLKLSGPSNHQQINLNPAGEHKAAPMFRWQGMGAIWRLDVSAVRTDIFFDLNGYVDTIAEIQPDQRPPQLVDVKKRLQPPLLALVRRLGANLQRLAVHSDIVVETTDGVAKFAALNMGGELRALAERGALQELSYRTNILHSLEAPRGQILCNRLVNSVAVENRVQLVIDANTVFPQDVVLGEQEAQTFFNWAIEWVAEKNAGFQA